MKINYYFIILLIFSCNSGMAYKENFYSGNNLIGKKLLIVPTKIKYYESKMFKDTKSNDYNEDYLSYNDTILNEILKKLNTFNLNLVYHEFDQEKDESFMILWKDLETNIKGDNTKSLSIEEFSRQKAQVIELFSKSNLTTSKYEVDYILIYKIQYFRNSDVKENFLKFSLAFNFLIGTLVGDVRAGKGDYPPTSGKGTLQYVLIDKEKNEIILIGEKEGLYIDDFARTNLTLSKFIKEIIEYDI